MKSEIWVGNPDGTRLKFMAIVKRVMYVTGFVKTLRNEFFSEN